MRRQRVDIPTPARRLMPPHVAATLRFTLQAGVNKAGASHNRNGGQPGRQATAEHECGSGHGIAAVDITLC